MEKRKLKHLASQEFGSSCISTIANETTLKIQIARYNISIVEHHYELIFTQKQK